jgi:hypothetical protein
VPVPEHARERDAIGPLDEFARRLSLSADYAEATRTALEALGDLFGFEQSILLVADEDGDRLFAAASNGYAASEAGAEVPMGVGVIGIAAERRRIVSVPSLARSRALRTAMEESLKRSGTQTPAHEIPLPGLERVQSAAAVPLIVRGDLTGVIYLESERAGDFGPGNERLLRVLGAQLAATLAALQADRQESVSSSPAPRPTAEGETVPVTYYQADDSLFVGGEYVIKGVPGRILWRLLGEWEAGGRTAFTNRELRLDESLGLPVGNDNLEARLLVLRRRLGAVACGIELDRVGRGRLELRVARPLELAEVATTSPMRAAHAPPDAG